MKRIVGVPLPSDRHVQVWFGEHVIAAFTGPAVEAAQYKAGMSRRFAGLQVTDGQAAAAVDSDVAGS